jgi:pre-mRNA-splicing helicase BRR2
VELFASSVTAKTKLRGLLDILASAAEYNVLPLRHRESKVLEVLARKLPQALPSDWEWDSTPTKAHILSQAHCTRTALPVDLREDQRIAVREAPRLLSAAVDVISSCGWLRPALEAMELTQMIVQACWGRDSYLKQVSAYTHCIYMYHAPF